MTQPGEEPPSIRQRVCNGNFGPVKPHCALSSKRYVHRMCIAVDDALRYLKRCYAIVRSLYF